LSLAACTLPIDVMDAGESEGGGGDDEPPASAGPSTGGGESESGGADTTTDATAASTGEAGSSSGSVDPSADTSGGAGECSEEVVEPVVPADRRLAIGYLYIYANEDLDPGLQARSLCLGDCLGIQNIDVRSLCLAMVNGDECQCEVIVDYDLRNVCQGNCEAIGTNPDIMNLCLGGEACELLQDHDMRSFCMGDCALIPDDPNFRYLCEGACNLIN
jgi:hypothetical protein